LPGPNNDLTHIGGVKIFLGRARFSP